MACGSVPDKGSFPLIGNAQSLDSDLSNFVFSSCHCFLYALLDAFPNFLRVMVNPAVETKASNTSLQSLSGAHRTAQRTQLALDAA